MTNAEMRLVDVVHIGFPKTGTTWLQTEFIATQSAIAAFGKPYKIDARVRDILNEVVSCDPFDFEPRLFRERFAQLLRERSAKFTDNQVRLISFELLSGEIFSAGEAKCLLDRIRAVFGSVKLVVTIREQASMVESLYRHYVRAGGALTIQEFVFERPSPFVDVFNTKQILRKYRYDRLIDYAQGLFGRGNVHVLIYEQIETDGPQAFLEKFGKAIGIANVESMATTPERSNASLSNTSIRCLCVLNRIIGTPHAPGLMFRFLRRYYIGLVTSMMVPLDQRVLRRIGSDRRFVDSPLRGRLTRNVKRLLRRNRREADSESVAKWIRAAYAESNTRTSRMIGRDLAPYGYAVSEKGEATASAWREKAQR